MATPGRKPKSTGQKKLEGNPGKRPLNENEPTPEPGEPKMPEHFCEEAEKTWRWLCGQLRTMNMLAKSDVAVMALYCETWAEYIKARKGVILGGMIVESEKGMEYVSPWMNVEAMLKKQLTAYVAELGLSASSRARLEVKKKEAGTEKERFFSDKTKMRIVG